MGIAAVVLAALVASAAQAQTAKVMVVGVAAVVERLAAHFYDVRDPVNDAYIHEYLLREFVRLNPNMTYVDPLSYL